MRPGEYPAEKAWCDDLAQRLADAFPDKYAGWTGEMVTKALKPYGIQATDVRLKDEHGVWRTKRGITFESFLEAGLRREAAREEGEGGPRNW